MGIRAAQVVAFAVAGSALAISAAQAQIEAVPPPPALSPIPGFESPVPSLAPPPPGPAAPPPASAPSGSVLPRERVTAEAANGATFIATGPAEERNLIVKLQVLLDRAGVSPGVID